MPLKIGINGAGIGGLAAAIALRKLGMDAIVYEQAPRFARVGADINLTPNAVLALDGLASATPCVKPPHAPATASAACGTPAKKLHACRCRKPPCAATAPRS